MVRFQCPHCSKIIASDKWEAGAAVVCAYCSKETVMPDDRLSPGMVIGDFLLIRKLGEGGMGIVYLAHQLSLDRPAAIKILNQEFSQQADSVQAFIKEARSAAKLNHTSIVQAYAVGEEDGIFYFAMEYIDGKTMKSVLQECKKLAPRKAAEIIMQIAEALDCAWREQKIIHHDIKPDNIMQCANDRVKLADLGLAGRQGDDANDDSDEVVGTPQYISPEQLTGVATDTRSDIYSLGATFYHFVTGQFPYNGENTDEIARQHVYGTLVPPKNVNAELPQALNDIIVKMMAKSPEERYQNCGDLVKDLKNFLNENGKSSSGGLTGSKPSGSDDGKLKLGGGLSGGGVQPKILAPANPAKLSIKKAVEKVEVKAAEPPAPADGTAAPEKAAEPAAAKPSIKLAIKKTADAQQESKLNLAMNQPKAVINEPKKITIVKDETSPADVPEENTAEIAAENSAVEAAGEIAAESAEDTALAVEDAAVQTAEPVSEERASGETQTAEATPAAEAVPEVKENTSEAEEISSPEKKSSGKVWLIIIITLLILTGAGAGGWYYWKHIMPGKSGNVKVEPQPKAAEKPAAKPQIGKFVIPEAEDVPVEKTPEQKVATYTPPPKAKLPQLSPFMKQARSLEAMLLSSESRFLQSWKQQAGRLKPKNAQEKKFYESLDENYVIADERVTVEPARKALAAAYKKRVSDLAKAAELNAFRARIVNAEKEVLAFSEANAQNYAADLPRKMGLLDYAMITAARSRRPADWKNFQKALQLAKAEPKRVEGREGFDKTARKLADYAERLEFAAEQGKEFTTMLEKNKFKGKKISSKHGAITVVSTNRNLMVFSVVTYPKAEAPKPAPKPKAAAKAPAKGKKAPAAKAKKLAPKPKPKAKAKPVKPKVHKIALMIKKPEQAADVKVWVSVLERDMGRRDQYFYYMLYNGYLQHSIAAVAPDKFWQKRADKVMRGYFDRIIFLANKTQLAAYKKSFGAWKSFQEALKAFEEKQ